MKTRVPLLLGLLVGGALVALVPWMSSLEVTNLDVPKRLLLPLSHQGEFFVEYTHSIYGSPVRERFQVRGPRIVLLGVETWQGAVAEYYGFQGSNRVFEATGEFPSLFLKVRMSPGVQAIEAAGRIDLQKMGRPGDRILLRPARSSPLCVFLKNRL